MISMIFAIDPNGLIGKNNDLPWYYPEDLRYFKATTLDHTVLMGRKTYESILKRNGKPLPRRHHVVATHGDNLGPGIQVVHDLVGYLKQPHDEEIFVIGGKQIFEQALPFADRLYITRIKTPHVGDTYLKINLDHFKQVRSEDHPDFAFDIYERT